MRILLYISIFLLAFNAKASHLLGGEITYDYISQNKYKIKVTLYRDCDDCKLGGFGGGNSQANCADISEVYLRTTGASCNNQNLGKVLLKRDGFEDITRLCGSAVSKCNNGSTYNFGIEAHYYSGTVDFDQYLAYSGCEIQVFLHKSERSNAINTLSTNEDDLFTYAILNPWVIQKKSPAFTASPKILFNVNQPVYGNDGIQGDKNDSLSIKWSTPYRNINSTIGYKDGYSSENFVSSHCPSGVPCAPNHKATMPEGIYLNSSTGDYVLTPTSSNQIGTRVIEVEQWHKVSGKMQRVGLVRRDIIVKVVSENYNLPPQILADDIYHVCLGDDLAITVKASDRQSTINGIPQPSDTVIYSISSSLGTSLTALTESVATAPYNQLQLSFSPDSTHIGIHRILIKAQDNYCPEKGQSEKVITIKVHSKPQVSIAVEDQFCGNNTINVSSNRIGENTVKIYASGFLNQTFENKYSYEYINRDKQDLSYITEFTDLYGCVVLDSSIIHNNGSSSLEPAQLSGDTIICDNEALRLNLSHSLYSLNNVEWEYRGSTFKQDTFIHSPNIGSLTVHYELTKDSLHCPLSLSSNIAVKKAPKISVPTISPLCFAQDIDLSSLGAIPNSGIWSGKGVSNNVISRKLLDNQDQVVRVTNTLSDQATGCVSDTSIEIQVLESPEMVLANQVVCGTKYPLRLINLIELPYFYSNKDLSWRALNNPSSLSGNGQTAFLDIPNNGVGKYEVEGINSLANGCIAKDTALVTVDKGLTLTTNGNHSICQQGEEVNLEQHLSINAEGGSWVLDNAEELLNGKYFLPTKCGIFNFKYVYDKNGCYDELDIVIEVICKPQFNTIIPDSICTNASTVNLDPKFSWSGPGITGFELNPAELRPVSFINARMVEQGCIYDTSFTTIKIEPNFLTLDNLPNKLCEGEKLNLILSNPLFANIRIEGCDINQYVSSSFDYEPNMCDLTKGSIDLELASITSAYCPIIKQSISIPYHRKPQIELPTPIKACWPYTAKEKIITSNNSLLTIYIQNDSTQITGNTLNHNFAEAGVYGLTVETSNIYGCQNSITHPTFFNLQHKPSADFSINGKSNLTLSDEGIYLTNESTITSGSDLEFNWSIGKDQLSKFSTNRSPYLDLPQDTGVFNIQLLSKSAELCSDTATKQIHISPDIIVYIPNAFTPDNKGPEQNSNFTIVSNHAQNFHIQIFNKWGQLVFESFDINTSWDGTAKGRYCQNGAYVYSLKIENSSGKHFSYQGTVNLIR